MGYETLYYFSRAFRKQYGLSPRAFRKSLPAGGKPTE
ncbi:MAG: helix-turn-helix transcriptional regulator [Kiritimatiellae bacterium]|nr:helix-turn-helix transcriptional regulator [Kiritimatiellia bacterium]